MPPEQSKILIVDDVPSNIDLLCEIFEAEGYEIIAAFDGPSALKAARRSAPDLIVLDVLLPGQDGFETCRILKKDPATAGLPVVFITAKDDQESRLAGFRAGGVDYITKPFEREEVVARSRAHLTISRLNRTLVLKNQLLEHQIDRCRAAEEEIRVINRSLEDRVAERTAQLEELNRRLGQDIAERKRVEETLREFPRRVIEAQEAERKRVAQELHDSVTQLLSSARGRVNWLLEQGGARRKATLEIASTVGDLLKTAIDEVRRVSQNLRPPELDDLGLAAATRSICEAFKAWSGAEVELEFAGVPERLPAPLALNLYRVIQEALSNVHKHAKATRVNIRLARNDTALELRVKDNGVGFDPAFKGNPKNLAAGFGLISMRERAVCLEGTFELISAPSSGTEIVVCLPFRAPADSQTLEH